MSRTKEKKEDPVEETVYRVSESDIRKTATVMCQKHTWREVNETELACRICPTQIIVSAEYLKELTA